MNHFSYPLTFVQINIFEEPQNIFSTKIPDPKLSSQPPHIFNYRVPPWGWKIHLVFTLQFFARHHGISSCREHQQLSRAPPVVRGTYSCQKNLQLSGLPVAVKSIFSCREHLQLSKVLPAVESTSTCPKYLQLRTPPVVESTSSCPKYLQLSRALQLSKVPQVVESTSSCRE